METAGDAFGYPFRDPGWVGKVAVQGLILIIPIVGFIALLGWMMITLDNLRAGRQELAPAGFHLERGIGIFGVLAIYAIVISIPADILDGMGAAVSANHSFSGSPLSGLGSLLGFAAQLFVDFLVPSLIVITSRHGFSAGLNVQKVWAMATSNMNNSVIAGLLVFVCGLISGVGILACCIGVLFTATYAGAVITGVAAWFERMQSAPAAPTA